MESDLKTCKLGCLVTSSILATLSISKHAPFCLFLFKLCEKVALTRVQENQLTVDNKRSHKSTKSDSSGNSDNVNIRAVPFQKY